MTRRRRAVRPLSVCNDLYSAHTRDLPACLPEKIRKKWREKNKQQKKKKSERQRLRKLV